MIFQNLLDNRQAQPRAIFFSITDKRLEYLVANALRNSFSIVMDGHFQATRHGAQMDVNFARAGLGCLAAIDQQVVKHAFQLLRIKPSLAVAFAAKRDLHAMGAGMALHRPDCFLQNLFHAGERER